MLPAVGAMRIAGWVAAGLVLGFVLGGIPVERERAELEARVEGLERELRRVDRPSILDSFLPRLGAPRAPAAEVATRDAASDVPGAPIPAATSAEAPEVDGRPAPQGDVRVIGEAPERRPRRGLFGFRERRRPRSGELEVYGGEPGRRGAPGEGGNADERTPIARFDEMAAVQRARAAASRAALIEQAGLDEGQVAQVDATVSRMNEQLAGYGEEMIDQVVQGEPPSPAQALGLGHDVSGILLDGQKALDAIVGDAAPAVDPEALEVWNYVDVEQWRPFVEARAKEAAAAPAPAEGSAGSGAAEGEE